MSSSKKNNAVAIDGPAGSGKSTVSRLVAEKLGYVYIDTGAMYRAMTLKVMRENVKLDDKDSIISLSHHLDIALIPSNEKGKTICVMLEGEDVSDEIRTMEVTVNVKHVCKIPEVRANLVGLQRKMVKDLAGAVMEGRDIGTVVLFDAEHKFFLDGSFEERVDRRYAELLSKGKIIERQEVADDLSQRDYSDRTREVGPLKQADDAVLVDTTGLSVEQVVNKIVGAVLEN